MDQNQPGGASAPADDAFMAELLGSDTGQQPEPQQQPEQREQPAERPVAREPERIPLPEYLSEREKRQAAERRIAEFEAADRKRQEDVERARAPKDFWSDPEGFVRNLNERFLSTSQQREQQFQQELMRQRVDMDERFVRQSNPEEFEPAQAWFVEQARSNPALLQEFLRQPSPCGWMIERHRQSRMISEVGSDPAAYRSKLEAELLANPEFLGRAMEAFKASAAGNPRFDQPRSDDGRFGPKSQQQQPRAQLPSMRNAGSAGSVTTRPSGDQSGDDLLDEVFAAP